MAKFNPPEADRPMVLVEPTGESDILALDRDAALGQLGHDGGIDVKTVSP